jgi:hypothetical protein
MKRSIVALTVVAALAFLASPSHAENFFDNYYPGYFTIQNPGQLNLTMYGGGFISDQYGATDQGVQAEQSITRYVGVFARATGYQLFMGSNFGNPLNSSGGHSSRLNFGRLQGGVDLMLFPGTHLYLSGGHDVADSDASVIEGDFSSWLLLHSFHPINWSWSAIHNFQNGVTSSSMDVQAIVASTEKYMILAGAGGAYYTGGFLGSVAGQGGPDAGFYYRPWAMGVSVQTGYGTARQYGQITFYKQLSINE